VGYDSGNIVEVANAMRMIRISALVCLCCFSVLAVAQSDAAKAFERMKTLAGTWEGKTSDGHVVSDTFQVTSAGGSLMSQLNADEPMVSMFYLDGDHLMMTHFCPSKNQPRMKASISPDGKIITFDFVDATNLAGSEAGHMHRAVYFITDSDHLSEEWTWLQAGKRSVDHFELHRKQ
jgi:hypothetical protein